MGELDLLGITVLLSCQKGSRHLWYDACANIFTQEAVKDYFREGSNGTWGRNFDLPSQYIYCQFNIIII